MSRSRGWRGRRWGTAARLAAFHAVVLAGIFATATAVVAHSFHASTSRTLRSELASEINSYSQSAAARGPVGLVAFSENYLRVRVLPNSELLAVALPGPVLLGSAGSEQLLASPVVRAWASAPATRSTELHRTIGGRPYDVVATPLHAGNASGTLIVAADLTSLNADVSKVSTLAAGEALLALVAAVTGAYLLLRRLVHTVNRIAATATRIGEGELDLRLGETGPDEFGRLAAAFDLMADRVSGAMTAQRRLLSDVSHQLRTPLTVARGHLEVLNRTGCDDPTEVHETIELVVDELQHMSTLVERLLQLGHALEPDFLVPEPVDVRSFCTDLFDAAQVLGPRHWLLDPLPDAVTRADPAKLRGAVLNLLANAVQATVPGDTVRLRVTEEPGGWLRIAVDDSGSGIPAGWRALAVDRFSRPSPAGGSASGGSGLGLAIVKAVAEAHGGRLELADSDLGGCAAALLLPLQRSLEVAR